MSKITSEILAKVAPGTPRAKRDRFLSDFNSVLPKYGITTELRVAAFLTTVCFESDYFKALAEYADGWAYDISRNKKKALGLGNTEVGDGPKYKGAGGIETTGKKNYQRLSDRLGVDFVAHPEELRTEKYFVEAACVFWGDNKFNALADKGKITAIQNLTNRGDAHKPALALSSRLKIYQTVLDILPHDFNLQDSAVPFEPPHPEQASANTADTSQDPPIVVKDNDTVQIENQSAPPPPQEEPVVVEKIEATPSIISKVKVWYGAVSGAFGTVLAGFFAWLQGASTVIIVSSAASVTIIALVWMIQKHMATQKEADRQLEREKMAHELNMAQVRSAADPASNTVIVK